MTDSNDPFSGPAEGGRFNAETNKGKLLLITPKSYEEGIETTFGTKDAVKADIVVIDEDNPSASEKIEDGLLFGGVLQGQTRPRIGKGLVLGRLGQGEAKKGQNPPWKLSDPTDDEKAKARAYLASQVPAL